MRFDNQSSNHPQPPALDDHNPTPEQLPMKLAAPIDVRSTALAVLALIALIVFFALGTSSIGSHHLCIAVELCADTRSRLAEEER
jgi:hypothetical protein